LCPAPHARGYNPNVLAPEKEPLLIRRHVIPEGLRVLPDGSWRVGDEGLTHARRLRYFKERLVFENGAAYVVDGARRTPITVEGPPFQVESTVFDAEKSEMRVRLDDGSEETLVEPVIAMNPDTGQFECVVKQGQTRAVLSRAAHDALLDQLEEDAGEFFVPLGSRRCRVVP
jgi:hypothetical protein